MLTWVVQIYQRVSWSTISATWLGKLILNFKFLKIVIKIELFFLIYISITSRFTDYLFWTCPKKIIKFRFHLIFLTARILRNHTKWMIRVLIRCIYFQFIILGCCSSLSIYINDRTLKWISCKNWTLRISLVLCKSCVSTGLGLAFLSHCCSVHVNGFHQGKIIHVIVSIGCITSNRTLWNIVEWKLKLL